jgi:hypothetical protein
MDWRAIPVDDLCARESSPTFADAEGVRFLLPAFLIAELDDQLPAGVVFTLIYDYGPEDHFAALSPAQRAAVREFLLVLRDDPKYEYDRQVIERSLQGYWAR